MSKTSKRIAQFNLLFTPSELRELKKRAFEQTGGNVSELIRRAMFPKPQTNRTVEEIVRSITEEAEHV